MRIFPFFILLPRNFATLMFIIMYFMRKKKLVNPTDSTYPKPAPDFYRCSHLFLYYSFLALIFLKILVLQIERLGVELTASLNVTKLHCTKK